MSYLSRYQGSGAAGNTLGQAAVDRMRAAGYSDSQIRSMAARDGFTLGAGAQSSLQGGSSGGSSINSALQQWISANPGNEAVSAAANDLFFNSLSAQQQTSSDVNYAQQMMPLALEFQRASQGIATGASMQQIAAQGAVSRDLVGMQTGAQVDIAGIQAGATRHVADQQLAGVGLQTDAQRYGADRQVDATRIGADAQVRSTQIGADAQRYGADRQVDATRIGADAQLGVAGIQAGATRYVADQQLSGVRYTADQQLAGTRLQTDAQRYGFDQSRASAREVADRQLAGTQYTADAGVRSTQIGADAQRDVAGITSRSQENQIRIRGGEDRKTLTQGTDETLRLRSDARGAIASTGGRFFG